MLICALMCRVVITDSQEMIVFSSILETNNHCMSACATCHLVVFGVQVWSTKMVNGLAWRGSRDGLYRRTESSEVPRWDLDWGTKMAKRWMTPGDINKQEHIKCRTYWPSQDGGWPGQVEPQEDLVIGRLRMTVTRVEIMEEAYRIHFSSLVWWFELENHLQTFFWL